jgi:murein DD-endopeptidase MepM/ murein hydrolase activator NlpD
MWLLRAGLVLASGLAVLIVIAAVLYTPIVRTAARVPGLTREVERLSAENRQVIELADRLEYAEERYAQIRNMLGGDVVPDLEKSEGTPIALRPLVARSPDEPPCYVTGQSRPSYWPLAELGVVTRGTVPEGSSGEVHTGLDIAVAHGTPIRATGGGVVSDVGEDAEYGLFIRMDHLDDYQSMYGHQSRLLVALGDTVFAGQVIGLAGSTGRSTAPHLHFEVLRGGLAVDPNALVSRECIHGDFLVGGG